MARPERRRKNSNSNNNNAFLPTTRQQQQRSEEDDAGMHNVPLNDSAAVTVKSSETDNRYSEEDSDDWGSSTGWTPRSEQPPRGRGRSRKQQR